MVSSSADSTVFSNGRITVSMENFYSGLPLLFLDEYKSAQAKEAKMLEEYFNIYIDSNGNLSRLPVLLDQYTPDMDHVLEFVLCLGNDVGDGSQFYMKGTRSSSINGQGNSSKTTVSLSDARGKVCSTSISHLFPFKTLSQI
nr:DNA mismatch repair protein MLH1 isoform X6 [Ipomoea trifida]